MMSNHTASLIPVATAALQDLYCYLGFIDPTTYQAELELLSGSTIGQHTRHIIEFYNCLIEQSAAGNDAIINYAVRRRDYLIESQPDLALSYVNNICAKLEELDESQTCMLDCAEHGQDGLLVQSTVGRELIYNIEHTIHHLAIVKIAIKAIFPSLELPEHFGVAPSTLRYRQEACAQ